MERVLHIVTHMNRGGLETMIMNYYRHINRSKLQFDFLVHRYERGDYDDEIEKMGGRIYRIPTLNPFSIVYRKELNSFFKNHREYHIVHCHLDCMSSLPLRYAKKNGVSFRIAHAHNTSQEKNLRYFIKIFYKQFIRCYATNLFACSRKAGQWMFNCNSFTVFNNAIDVDLFDYDEELRSSIRKELNIEKDYIVIGHVGRFNEQKNHLFLIDIFYCFYQKNPKSILMLVGDNSGEIGYKIKNIITKLNIEKNVMILGIREDIPILMQGMDLFVFPSLFEGFGIAILEAQAEGLPCIISKNIPNECCVTNLVHKVSLSDDARVWSDVALKLLGFPRKSMSESIKQANYDVKRNAIQLQDFYLSEIRKVNCDG